MGLTQVIKASLDNIERAHFFKTYDGKTECLSGHGLDS